MSTIQTIKNILSKLKGRINASVQFPISEKEKKFRQRNLDIMKETLLKYKQQHPGFKTPREFKDLE